MIISCLEYANNDPVNQTDPTGLCSIPNGNPNIPFTYVPGPCTGAEAAVIDAQANAINQGTSIYAGEQAPSLNQSTWTSAVESFDPLYGAVAGYSDCRNSGYSVYTCANMNFNPAYGILSNGQAAIDGWSNPCVSGWQEAENIGLTLTSVGGTYLAADGATSAIRSGGYFSGNEIKIGNNIRISPFGNEDATGPGSLPHYHWRSPDEFGNSPPGQGIGQHRPWEGGWFPW